MELHCAPIYGDTGGLQPTDGRGLQALERWPMMSRLVRSHYRECAKNLSTRCPARRPSHCFAIVGCDDEPRGTQATNHWSHR